MVSGKAGLPGFFNAMKYIIGEKLGSTQILNDKGEITPVTLVSRRCGCFAIKTPEKDGYTSVQVGSGFKRKRIYLKHLRDILKNWVALALLKNLGWLILLVIILVIGWLWLILYRRFC